jgi:hypothetical protein
MGRADYNHTEKQKQALAMSFQAKNVEAMMALLPF